MREFGVALARWLYETGERVDACGASLRESWLEASFAGDQADVLSRRPPPSLQDAADEPDTLPPDGTASQSTVSGQAEAVVSARRPPPHATEAGTSLAPREPESGRGAARRRPVLVVGIASAAIGVALGTALLVATGAGDWVRSAGTGAEAEPGGAQRSEGDGPGPAGGLGSADTDPADSPGVLGSAAPPSSAAPASSAKASKGKKQYVRPRPRRIKKKSAPADYDFGF
jgi:hypothetical protein